MAPSSGTLREPELIGNWTLQSTGCSARFHLRQFFGLSKVSGSVPAVGGELVMTRGPVLRRLCAELDATRFETGNAKRDEHVRGPDFLDTATNPVWSYNVLAFDLAGSEVTLPGALTVCGITNRVPMTARIALSGGRAKITATGRVDRTAFGVTKLPGIIGKKITISVEVVFVRDDRDAT